jgi:hypothetical protein
LERRPPPPVAARRTLIAATPGPGICAAGEQGGKIAQMEQQRFASFREFYPYYLQQHTNRTSRRLHVTGTLLALASVGVAVASGRRLWLLVAPLAGYLPAWFGHLTCYFSPPALQPAGRLHHADRSADRTPPLVARLSEHA